MIASVVLLSLDEARDQLGATAINLVETVHCPPGRLARLLYGTGTTRGLADDARHAVKAHRVVLRRILASDHAWIVDEELQGALSYAAFLSEPQAHTIAA